MKKEGSGADRKEDMREAKPMKGKPMMSENERMFRNGMVSPKAAKKHMKAGAAPSKAC